MFSIYPNYENEMGESGVNQVFLYCFNHERSDERNPETK